MGNTLSRRDFLKIGAASAGVLATISKPTFAMRSLDSGTSG